MQCNYALLIDVICYLLQIYFACNPKSSQTIITLRHWMLKVWHIMWIPRKESWDLNTSLELLSNCNPPPPVPPFLLTLIMNQSPKDIAGGDPHKLFDT